MSNVSFDIHGDYKTEFMEKAKVLVDMGIKDRPERITLINELCETYTATTGQTPDSYPLVMLANYILKEELSDPDSNKARKTEYSFLSDDQLDRREDKEVALNKLEHTISIDGKRVVNGTKNRS